MFPCNVTQMVQNRHQMNVNNLIKWNTIQKVLEASLINVDTIKLSDNHFRFLINIDGMNASVTIWEQ